MKQQNVIERVEFEKARSLVESEYHHNEGNVVVSYYHDDTPDGLFPNPLVYSHVQCFTDVQEIPCAHVGMDGAEIALDRIVEYFIVRPTEQQLENRKKMKQR